VELTTSESLYEADESGFGPLALEWKKLAKKNIKLNIP